MLLWNFNLDKTEKEEEDRAGVDDGGEVVGDSYSFLKVLLYITNIGFVYR